MVIEGENSNNQSPRNKQAPTSNFTISKRLIIVIWLLNIVWILEFENWLLFILFVLPPSLPLQTSYSEGGRRPCRSYNKPCKCRRRRRGHGIDRYRLPPFDLRLSCLPQAWLELTKRRHSKMTRYNNYLRYLNYPSRLQLRARLILLRLFDN